MFERESLYGKSIDCFRDSLLSEHRKQSPNDIWTELSSGDAFEGEYQPDSKIVKADYLINNIDLAFETWQNAPWRDSISFNIFKEYVLPYSIAGEPIIAWREYLNKEYKHVVEGINNPKEAFKRLHYHITKEKFHLTNEYLHYGAVLDPVTAQVLLKGTCDVQTLLVVSAARSLAIPSAYDYVNYWANYSEMGHSWATYIDNQEIPYTIISGRVPIIQKRGPINSSYFPRSLSFDDKDTPFKVDSLKKAAKVMRYCFSYFENSELQKDEFCPSYLKGNGWRDVSSHYGFNGNLNISLDKDNHGYIYLCHFVNGKGWTPAIGKKQTKKEVTFNDLGKGIAYLPATVGKHEIKGLTNPVILEDDNSQRILTPNLKKQRTVTLLRKYPLFTRWLPNRWKETIGISFEGSNDPDFKIKDTLHHITQESLGILSIKLRGDKFYRYLRAHSPKGEKLKLYETIFYGLDDIGKETELSGKLIFNNIEEENANRLFDKNYMSEASSKSVDYWVGIDIGEENRMKVSRIYYCPWNDGNMVEPGNMYELLYYDMGWHSLGKKMAEKDFITYDNVPDNALLWLKNHTKGEEERIFTYENGKQIWW